MTGISYVSYQKLVKEMSGFSPAEIAEPSVDGRKKSQIAEISYPLSTWRGAGGEASSQLLLRLMTHSCLLLVD